MSFSADELRTEFARLKQEQEKSLTRPLPPRAPRPLPRPQSLPGRPPGQPFKDKAPGLRRPSMQRGAMAGGPPMSAEAEMGILSSVLNDNASLRECAGRISPEHFFIPAHRTVYLAMLDLWASGAPIELITFTQHLRDRGLLEQIGGAFFVTQ